METHGKCNKLVQGKMLKFRILASPKQPFPLSVTFALVVGVDALLYLRAQFILLTGEPVFPSWCNPFYMNLSSGGGKNGNYQQTKGAAALRQSSFLQSCLCQTHVKDRNNIHSNAIRANSFRRRRVEVFTTGLSCRTMSYSKQEVGGIFLWLKHTEAPSPVLSMEKATQSPI